MGVSTLPELRELAMRVLAEPVGADAGERIWSTYIFIVDNRRNRLSVDRARKLVYAHFNVRSLKKVRGVDYNSEYLRGRLRRWRLRARLRRNWLWFRTR
jgi:hypothetical protein